MKSIICIFTLLNILYLPPLIAQQQRIPLSVLKAQLMHVAYFYAYICYRPGNSLPGEVHRSDLRTYHAELLEEINGLSFPVEKTPETLEPLRKSLEVLLQRYTAHTILACAKRNYMSLSAEEQQWMGLFEKYGVETDNFEEGMALSMRRLLKTPIIFVGNNHFLEKQGGFLFNLIPYLKKNSSQVRGLLLEHNPESKSKFLDIMTLLSKHVREKGLGTLTPEEAAQKITEQTNAQQEAKARPQYLQYLLIEQQRTLTHYRLALTYPSLPVLSIDTRENGEEYWLTSMDLTRLRTILANTSPPEQWLGYYGSGHIMRHPFCDAHALEQEFTHQDSPLELFLIGQGFGMLAETINRAWELKYFDVFYQAVVNKFIFPITSTPDPNEPLDILSLWERMVSKYRTVIRRNRNPIYVDFLNAMHQGDLHFNDNVRPYDLYYVAPIDEEAAEFYTIENDPDYNYLSQLINVKEFQALSKRFSP